MQLTNCPLCGGQTQSVPCDHCGGVFDPSAVDTAIDLDPGPMPGSTTIGGYRLEDRLAGGGMGVVLRGRDRRDRPIVIKAPRTNDERARARFTREARALSSLDHGNIVPLRDIDATAAGMPLLVLEHLPGVTLRQVLRHRRLDLAPAARIATELCRALDHCRRRGVVHRDIKPENIIIGPGRVWLIDFGLARVDVGHAVPAAVDFLTPHGALLGTPPYAAPEQICDPRQAGFAADAYSLGMTLRECLPEVARLPVHQRAAATMWWQIVERLCDPDPARRPSPAAVLRTAPAIVDDHPVTARIEALPRRQRRRRDAAWMLAALGMGLIIGGAATWLAGPWSGASAERMITGSSTPDRAASVVLSVPADSRIRLTPDRGTKIRLPGGGPWRSTSLVLQTPADGSLALRVVDTDGQWQIAVSAE